MADLAALLDQEAGAEIDSILSEARQRASEIAAEAKEEAERITAQAQRAAETQRDAGLVRAKSAAQLEASSMRLRAQHEALETVFGRVRDELSNVTQDQGRYRPILRKLLEEALGDLSGDPGTLTVHPNDEELIREVASELNLDLNLDVDIKTSDAVVGGVRVKSKGNTSVDNTLLGRLEALRDELSAEVAKVLFEKAA